MKTPVQTTQYRNKSGFTLIEIVIVLAIAALIMVIVFVAVQGAQRSRRDTERRAAASRVLAGLVSCASDNKGTIGGPVATATNVQCGSYITGVTNGDITGKGTLATAATNLPTSINKGYISAAANAANACVAAATLADGSPLTSGGGNICAYYWSEASNSVVVLSSNI